MIMDLTDDLKGRKLDIEFMANNPDKMKDVNLQEYIEKYNRMYSRLAFLIACYKKRRTYAPVIPLP